jgi:hypothetical protein
VPGRFVVGQSRNDQAGAHFDEWPTLDLTRISSRVVSPEVVVVHEEDEGQGLKLHRQL